jgi:DNA-binding XRE family transcriptional regulator
MAGRKPKPIHPTHPQIAAVTAASPPVICVIWDDGTEHTIDLGAFIADHPGMDAITAAGVFDTIQIGEGRRSAGWTDDTEICAGALWSLGVEQEAAQLHDWRKARGLTQEDAASALGISMRMIAYYEAGRYPIPKTITLARIGLDSLRQQAA